MVSIQCQTCNRKMRVGEQAAGKSVRCPCGSVIQVPVSVSSQPTIASGGGSSTRGQSSTTSNAQENALFVHNCQCGRKLRVPKSAKAKTAKCPCGEAFEIPPLHSKLPPQKDSGSQKFSGSPTTATPVPTAIPVAIPTAIPTAIPMNDVGTDWEKDIPAAPYGVGVPVYQEAVPLNSANHFGSSNFTSNPYSYSASQPSSEVNPYLAQAIQERSSSPGRGESYFDGTVIGGIVAMLIAVVWFVGGLSAGYIFFYPPVMFVLGLIAVIRGLLD